MRLIKTRILQYLRSQKVLRLFIRSLKMFFVRQLYGFRHVHKTFYLGGKADISSDFVAEAYSYVGMGASICPKVSIGAYTLLAHEVTVLGGDHSYDRAGVPICFTGRPELPKTNIGKDVWIGHRVIIKAGTTIGNGAIIASGAVVTKNVKDYSIVGGVPAKLIGQRFPDPSERKIHERKLNEPPTSGALPPQRVTGVSGN